MAIAPINDRTSHPLGFNTSNSSTRGVGKNSQPTLSTRTSKPDDTTLAVPLPDAVVADTTEIDSHDSEKSKGVLNLLESGHFRGVAGVRLRINFFEELNAREQDRVQGVAEEGLVNLTSVVRDSLQELLAPLELDEETQTAIDGLVADFSSTVASLADDFSSGILADADALANALQSAFADLAGQIQFLLSPSDSDTDAGETPESLADLMLTRTTSKEATLDSLEAEALNLQTLGIDDITGALAGSLVDATEPADDTPAVSLRDPSADPVAVIGTDELDNEDASSLLTEQDDALITLADIFHQALNTFLTSLATETSSVELNAPNGNGVAYDKFLTQYQDLLGLISTTVDEQA